MQRDERGAIVITKIFLPLDQIPENPVHVDYSLNAIPEFSVGAVAGLDLGKRRHPSHLSVLLPIRSKVYQVASVWFDAEPYTKQISEIRQISKKYNVQLCYFDNTRHELDVLSERGELPDQMVGLAFDSGLKERLATRLELALERGELVLLADPRQKKSILQVTNSLDADEDAEGNHAEAFWSLALALDAAVALGHGQPVPFVIPLGRRSKIPT
jgi:hypothetical protein